MAAMNLVKFGFFFLSHYFKQMSKICFRTCQFQNESKRSSPTKFIKTNYSRNVVNRKIDIWTGYSSRKSLRSYQEEIKRFKIFTFIASTNQLQKISLNQSQSRKHSYLFNLKPFASFSNLSNKKKVELRTLTIYDIFPQMP